MFEKFKRNKKAKKLRELVKLRDRILKNIKYKHLFEFDVAFIVDPGYNAGRTKYDVKIISHEFGYKVIYAFGNTPLECYTDAVHKLYRYQSRKMRNK